jgi:hypothetical protein
LDLGEGATGRRAIILTSLFVAVAGVVPLSAQVTSNFRAERERLVHEARETQLAKGLSAGEILCIPLLTPMAGPESAAGQDEGDGSRKEQWMSRVWILPSMYCASDRH